MWVNVVSSVETSKKLKYSEVAGGGRVTFWFQVTLWSAEVSQRGWGVGDNPSVQPPPLSLVLLSYSCIVGMHS